MSRSGCPSGCRHTAGTGQFAAIQTAAPSLGWRSAPINVRDAREIERAVAAFARCQMAADRDGERARDVTAI